MRERAAQTASVLVIFLVTAMKYLAFQPAEERKTRSGSQFGAIHSILAGGKRDGSCRGLQLWWWWGLAGVWVDQEAKRGLEQSPGWDRNCSALLGNHFFLHRPFKGPTASPNSATSWRSNVQTHELRKNISHPNSEESLSLSQVKQCSHRSTDQCKELPLLRDSP